MTTTMAKRNASLSRLCFVDYSAIANRYQNSIQCVMTIRCFFPRVVFCMKAKRECAQLVRCRVYIGMVAQPSSGSSTSIAMVGLMQEYYMHASAYQYHLLLHCHNAYAHHEKRIDKSARDFKVFLLRSFGKKHDLEKNFAGG